MNMIVRTIFILALTFCRFGNQLVAATQWYQTTANNVGGILKRDTEERGCRLPSPLNNGRYTPSSRRCSPQNSSPACRMVPGTRVPEDWPIFYECDPGYVLRSPDGVETTKKWPSICNDGQWTSISPVCVESRYSSQSLLQFQSPGGVCGKPVNLTRRKRKVYGTVARKGAWPWMVIFGMLKNNTESREIHWFCAGTLVTTRHILTAAHCVADYRKRNTFFARFNDIDLDDTSDDSGKIEVEIQKNNIVVHPGFKKEQVFSQNLAIIKLNDDIPVTDYVRPICLPTPDFTGKSFDNEIGYFTSWGQTDNDREWNRKRRYQPILQELTATMINHAECNYNYRNYQSDDFIIIGWDLICASVPTNKSCQGDAGSPLMLKIKDTYILIGVVATPFRCYDELFPRLFTRLSTYMDWIIANVKF